VSALIGEYGQARYIKHPVPSAAAPGGNGITFDAGTACIVDNNASWLCRESCRHLAASPGPGSVTVFANLTKLLTDNIVNFGPPRGDASPEPVGEIPWDRRVAVRLGPFSLVCDELSSGQVVPRLVSASTHLTIAGGTPPTVDLYWAVTTSPSTQALMRGDFVMFGKSGAVSSGLNAKALSTTSPIANADVRAWPCRASATSTATYVRHVPAWIWFGWRAIGAGTVTINGLSAWEAR
jgi:hypothetical protein